MEAAAQTKGAAQGGEPSKLKQFDEYTPVQQWDIVMRRAMNEKIVGKRGYKKIIRGKIEVVNQEYFSKDRVQEVGQVAAQGIRAYRATLEKALNTDKDKLNAQLREEQLLMQSLPWWRRARRRETASLIGTITVQLDVIQTALRHCKETAPEITPQERVRLNSK